MLIRFPPLFRSCLNENVKYVYYFLCNLFPFGTNPPHQNENGKVIQRQKKGKELYSERYRFTSLCYAKSLQSCPTLCDPIDGSPPGSPVPGILQARTLEWVAISFSNA